VEGIGDGCTHLNAYPARVGARPARDLARGLFRAELVIPLEVPSGARHDEVVTSERLTARSPELLRILAERFEGEALDLYTGALRIAFDDANPARLPLAASALREAMDDLEGEGGFAHRIPDWR
jgi:hypothetical protein